MTGFKLTTVPSFAVIADSTLRIGNALIYADSYAPKSIEEPIIRTLPSISAVTLLELAFHKASLPLLIAIDEAFKR